MVPGSDYHTILVVAALGSLALHENLTEKKIFKKIIKILGLGFANNLLLGRASWGFAQTWGSLQPSLDFKLSRCRFPEENVRRKKIGKERNVEELGWLLVIIFASFSEGCVFTFVGLSIWLLDC